MTDTIIAGIRRAIPRRTKPTPIPNTRHQLPFTSSWLRRRASNVLLLSMATAWTAKNHMTRTKKKSGMPMRTNIRMAEPTSARPMMIVVASKGSNTLKARPIAVHHVHVPSGKYLPEAKDARGPCDDADQK